MNKLTLSFCLIAAAAVIYSIATTAQLSAQSSHFSSVIPFFTSIGRMAFFDQGSGKLYIYDEDGKECLYKGQLSELGKPLTAITSESTPPRSVQTPQSNKKITINERGEKTITLDP